MGGAEVDQCGQRGPLDSAYAGGEYHGMIMFPSEYPFKPPGIKVRVQAAQVGREVSREADFSSLLV
jgi:ubiquitin-protein ligase